MDQISDNKLLTKRNIIVLVVLIVLAVAIPLGLKLIQQQQTIRSRASTDTPQIRFVQGANVNCDTSSGNCTTTADTVDIELVSPTWE